jgi:hypothetical protein
MSGVDPEEPRPLGDLPPRQRRLLATAFIAGGSAFVAGGMRWIDIAPAPGVPHWIIGVIGAIFVIAGIAVAMRTEPSRGHDLVGALIVTGFASVFGWIGFGPGERHFGSSVSGAGVSLAGGGGDWIGRAVFGLGAILCALAAAYLWKRVFFRPARRGGAAPSAE